MFVVAIVVVTAILFILVRWSKTIKSMLLGYIDDISVILSSFQKISHFKGGLLHDEKEKYFKTLNKTLLENPSLASNAMPASKVTYSEWKTDGSIKYSRAKFISPIKPYLANTDEEQVYTVNAEVVIPSNMSFEEVIEKKLPIVIHFPATGDEGFTMRRNHIAKHLINGSSPIASIILQLPYYGQRRLKRQTNYALDCLSQIGEQSFAAVMEGNALVNYLVKTLNYQGKILLSGISFGGAMAALSSQYCLENHAVISMVPANSPRDAYVHGIMGKLINWQSFHRITENQDIDSTTSGKRYMGELLGMMDIGSNAGIIAASMTSTATPVKVYYQLSAVHDKYVPYQYSKEMFEQFAVGKRFQYQHLDELVGGHASAILFDRGIYLQRVREALSKLESLVDEK